jgi:hypothetical protein
MKTLQQQVNVIIKKPNIQRVFNPLFIDTPCGHKALITVSQAKGEITLQITSICDYCQIKLEVDFMDIPEVKRQITLISHPGIKPEYGEG